MPFLTPSQNHHSTEDNTSHHIYNVTYSITSLRNVSSLLAHCFINYMKQGTIKISKISKQFISIHVLGQVQSRLHKRLKRLGE